MSPKASGDALGLIDYWCDQGLARLVGHERQSDSSVCSCDNVHFLMAVYIYIFANK